jgi:hypothetical protein
MRSAMWETYCKRQQATSLEAWRVYHCISSTAEAVSDVAVDPWSSTCLSNDEASPSPPPRPPTPTDEELSASAAPSRPPLPESDAHEGDNYDRDLPIPQSNQPILVRSLLNRWWDMNLFVRWLLMICISIFDTIPVMIMVWLLWQKRWLISLLIWVYWSGRISADVDRICHHRCLCW